MHEVREGCEMQAQYLKTFIQHMFTLKNNEKEQVKAKNACLH